MYQIKKDSTDVTLYVLAVDEVSGLPKTGLVYSNLTARFIRTRSAPATITMASLALVTSPHADGGFIELDATNCKGWYRFDLPDAAVATGADQAVVTLQASGALVGAVVLQLVDAVYGDLTDDLGNLRRFICNSRQIDHANTPNVETILDDDDETPYATITQSEPETGLLKETVEVL